MTNKEKEIYEALRVNPSLSQNELAKKLNITRSSASVHISNLIKKGYVRGRGYILNEPGYVTVIGAANYDIVGRSAAPLIAEDSNPGSIQVCAGGVGRNIAENLARIGVSVKLISALGDDISGNKVSEISTAAGVDMNHCYIKPNGHTSTYMAILENSGEMNVAMSDMGILNEMPLEHIGKKQMIISNSELIVLDANLTQTMLEYILANFTDCRLFIDPVSVSKAHHIKRHMGAFDTIKANRFEAEVLTEVSISDDGSLRQAGEVFLQKGVRQVFISLGSRGLYYRTADEENFLSTIPICPVNATGAGDALMAGVVFAALRELSCREAAEIGNAMSRIALMSELTVSPLMSMDNVKYEMTQAKYNLDCK